MRFHEVEVKTSINKNSGKNGGTGEPVEPFPSKVDRHQLMSKCN